MPRLVSARGLNSPFPVAASSTQMRSIGHAMANTNQGMISTASVMLIDFRPSFEVPLKTVRYGP
ncbi:hypothetical protein E4U58_005679, partial [Claviceps cyperi]